ncbi:MAG TPA: tRNA (adenosine(37)-N6)-dimethylallyltransferase MiaA [bacterium]|nr:tRNA (adenosine(37)-N6)-dimethylallyltransferase MiaA [bacterium]
MKKFSGAIISCDSRQIYKEMDVATDKIPYSLPYHDPITFQGIDHFGINIAEIDKPFTLYDWMIYCREAIDKINSDGKIPFMVGGTGLYIQSIIDNYELKPDFDVEQRDKLNKLSLPELQNMLKKMNPDLYEKVDYKNPRRLIRAIEKSQMSNLKCQISNKDKFLTGEHINRFESLVLSFRPDRELIRQRIENRVKKHQVLGVIDEVKKLVEKYGPENEILNSTISVQEYIPYVLGKIKLEEAQERVVINNYQYAKRQMTWFRKYGNTVFVDNVKEMDELIKKFLR